MIAMIFFLLAAGAVGFMAGILVGHSIGVRDTERRWSDAVGKAEWGRKHHLVTFEPCPQSHYDPRNDPWAPHYAPGSYAEARQLKSDGRYRP